MYVGTEQSGAGLIACIVTKVMTRAFHITLATPSCWAAWKDVKASKKVTVAGAKALLAARGKKTHSCMNLVVVYRLW